MLTYKELIVGLESIGLGSGDHLIVHSSLRAIGPVEGGAETVISAVLDVIGKTGNMLLPAFNYTTPAPDPCFDPETTPARTGAIVEMARKMPGAVRSLHPSHSVAVIGPDAVFLTENHLAFRAVGVGSPLDRLAGMGGKVLLLGVSNTSNTMVHLGEEHAGVPKKFPTESRKVKMPAGHIIEHMLDTSTSCSAAFNAVEYFLRKRGQISDGRIGGALVQLQKSSDVIKAVCDMVRESPGILLCSKEKCPACSGTREALQF